MKRIRMSFASSVVPTDTREADAESERAALAKRVEHEKASSAAILQAGLIMTKAATKFLRVVRLRNAVNSQLMATRSAKFNDEKVRCTPQSAPRFILD